MAGEMGKEEIRKQAREILDSFSRALAGVSIKEKAVKSEVGGFREEGAGEKRSGEFREGVFANASKKNEDCIIAEKKSW